MFGERLKQLRKEKGMSQRALGEKLGVSQQTIAQYEKAYDAPKFTTAKKLADALNIPVKELLTVFENGDEIIDLNIAGMTSDEIEESTDILFQKPRITIVSSKDEKDIEKLLDSFKEQLLSQESLMFDGEPASPEAIDSILAAMQIGMEMAKKKNKEKYTPKKYKKD